MKYRLICCKCGRETEQEPAYKCQYCGNILEFKFDFGKNHLKTKQELPGIFRFSPQLPITETDAETISMGEGNTPLIPAVKYKRKGKGKVWWKLELMNPTGSFKDRASAVFMSCGKKFGIHKMMIASSGNAGASAAAYAARCGMELTVVVPERTPANKVMQAETHGCRVIKVPGPFSNSYHFCREAAVRYGWFDLTTTFINPYAREGYKTIGYEIFEQLGRQSPDWIVIPTGAGPILTAVFQAFQELKQMGETEKLPRLVCVQAKNCGPIAEAYLGDQLTVRSREKPEETIASGINDSLQGYEDDGDYTLACIRASKGTAVLLEESEIYHSVLRLAEEGIYAEPAGAVAAAAIEQLIEQGKIKKNETVVGIVTGHGLKNPLKLSGQEPPVMRTPGELERNMTGGEDAF